MIKTQTYRIHTVIKNLQKTQLIKVDLKQIFSREKKEKGNIF